MMNHYIRNDLIKMSSEKQKNDGNHEEQLLKEYDRLSGECDRLSEECENLSKENKQFMRKCEKLMIYSMGVWCVLFYITFFHH